MTTPIDETHISTLLEDLVLAFGEPRLVEEVIADLHQVLDGEDGVVVRHIPYMAGLLQCVNVKKLAVLGLVELSKLPLWIYAGASNTLPMESLYAGAPLYPKITGVYLPKDKAISALATQGVYVSLDLAALTEYILALLRFNDAY